MSGQRRKGKLGIALAGGGPLGGIYEIGALLALEKALPPVQALSRWPRIADSGGVQYHAGVLQAIDFPVCGR